MPTSRLLNANKGRADLITYNANPLHVMGIFVGILAIKSIGEITART